MYVWGEDAKKYLKLYESLKKYAQEFYHDSLGAHMTRYHWVWKLLSTFVECKKMSLINIKMQRASPKYAPIPFLAKLEGQVIKIKIKNSSYCKT